MESEKKETNMIYWHPAFFADIQIELEEDADNLEFTIHILRYQKNILEN